MARGDVDRTQPSDDGQGHTRIVEAFVTHLRYLCLP
jgi:hypothetical protein